MAIGSIASTKIAVFDFDSDVRLDAGERRQQMIQNLLRRCAKLSTTRTDLQPTLLVAIIALGRALGVDEDEVTLIRKVHAIG